MLRSLIISPGGALGIQLEQILKESHRVDTMRRLDRYPEPLALGSALRSVEPHVVFISMDQPDVVADIVRQVRNLSRGTVVVAVASDSDPDLLLRVMRLGIREFLGQPFKMSAVQEIIGRVEESKRSEPLTAAKGDCVYAFLPAKMGVGSTTLAVHTALALARKPESRTLIMDLDLNTGLVAFMLGVKPGGNTVIDAAESAHDIDPALWAKLVISQGQLDILQAGSFRANYRIDPTNLRTLLDYARRNYQAICVDMSGVMEKFSLEVLQEARRIYLVVTPELPALHLAQSKLTLLRDMELLGRVEILLNRDHTHTGMPMAELEKVLGQPVTLTIPNQYAALGKAMMAGKSIEPGTALGRRIEELADRIIPSRVSEPDEKGAFAGLFALKKKFAL